MKKKTQIFYSGKRKKISLYSFRKITSVFLALMVLLTQTGPLFAQESFPVNNQTPSSLSSSLTTNNSSLKTAGNQLLSPYNQLITAKDGPTAAEKVNDPSTLMTYKSYLINDETGSLHAGRLWSDKTVFSNQTESGRASEDENVQWTGNTLKLTDGDPGKSVTAEVSADDDFLHVYSALASGQIIEEAVPLDVMFLVDVSGSMGNGANGEIVNAGNFQESRIAKTVKAVNSTINLLLQESPDTRFGISIYGSTAATLVPLGHYKINPDSELNRNKDENSYVCLSASYVDQYGTAAGLTFNIQADLIQVKNGEETAVQYYGSNGGSAQWINGSGNRRYTGTSGQTEGERKDKDNPLSVGHITNPQAGIAEALDQLIENNEETTWFSVNANKIRTRIPAFIHLTDGQSTDLAAIATDSTREHLYTIKTPGTETGVTDWSGIYSNWNNVDTRYDLAYNAKTGNSDAATARNAQQMGSDSDAPPIILQTLMTAGYYASAVENYYRSAPADNAGDVELQGFSIYADEADLNGSSYKPNNKALVEGILNPAEEFRKNTESETESSEYRKFLDTADGSGAYNLYSKWKGTEESGYSDGEAITGQFRSGTQFYYNLNIGQEINEDSKYYSKDNSLYNITKADIAGNIEGKKSYVEPGNFYTAQNFDTELQDVFTRIIKELTETKFTLLSGENDLGMEDSVTYADPLGQYMDIKNGAVRTAGTALSSGEDNSGLSKDSYDMSVFLFGQMHGVIRSAVYDPDFNEKAASKTGNVFKEGWYSGTDGDSADYAGQDSSGKPELPSGFSEIQAWNNGWVYRISENTVSKSIPKFSKEDKASYTIYRFAEKTSDRGKARFNTAYGEAPLQSELVKLSDTDTVSRAEARKQASGVYALNDIKIWTEKETGKSYENTLYINIPANALPLEVSKIKMEKSGTPSNYETNCGSASESTPFRLFYSVGFESETRDDEGGIDLSKVDQEYIKDHTIVADSENNNGKKQTVCFYSNYYNGDGKGASLTNFSPANENYYYFLQKPAILFKVPEDGIPEDGSAPPDIILDEDGYDSVGPGKTFDTDYYIPVDDFGDLEEDGWYYIISESYKPDSGNPGMVNLGLTASARKISELKADLKGTVLDTLSWYQSSTGSEVAVTADVPDHGKPEDAEHGGWTLAAKTGSYKVGSHYEGSSKSTNETETAPDYYDPAITAAETGESMNVTHYLGNNGLLAVPYINLEFPVKKILVNKPNVYSGKFTFEISADEDTASNNGFYFPEDSKQSLTLGPDGEDNLGPVTFTKAGEYTFKIRETDKDSDPDIEYDQSEWTVTVNIEGAGDSLRIADVVFNDSFDNGELDDQTKSESTLTRSEPKQSEEYAEFVNIYNTPDWLSRKIIMVNTFTKTVEFAPSVSKTLIAGSPRVEEETFVFTLTESPDNPDGCSMPEITEVRVTGSGKASFGNIVFEQPGTYHFEISETPGALSGMEYDSSQYDLEIVVKREDNGELIIENSNLTKKES